MTTTALQHPPSPANPVGGLGRTFLTIWFGQVISMLGTGMTRFAALTWAYQQTGDATTVALLGFFSFLPFVIVGPFAGVWIDRSDRRKIMMLADSGAGMMTVGMLILFASGELRIWHLYVAELLTGLFDSFHQPAYNASISLLVPRTGLARANALRSLGYTAAQVAAPVLASLLLPRISLGGVMLMDCASFLFAVAALIFVRIPRPVRADGHTRGREPILRELRQGFTSIWSRPGLPGLLFIYTGINFAGALTYLGVMPAMILTRAPGDDVEKALALATIQAMLGVGGVVGGLILAATGGPRRKIYGLLGGAAASFFLGDLLFAVGRDPRVWSFAAFAAAAFIPLMVASARTIWQTKIAPELQGRVFAIQGLFEQAALALGYLLAGPLADQVFGPAMMPDGALAPHFGPLVGTGPGAGMGLMFMATCLMGTLISLSGFLRPAIRDVEARLPDALEDNARNATPQ